MQSYADKASLYVDAAGIVDVRKLIAAYSFEEHAARADAYFKSVDDPWVHHLRKPFQNPEDARVACNGLAALLSMGALRPGDEVVDFGCGTGWLTAILALMGCRPIAMDVSAEALNIARSYMQSVPSLRQAPIRFEVVAERLPLADASVDKIICFDVFHHMPDQHATLREFARILRPGGSALFHEPGPGHSRSAVAQQEMRDFAVIENEVDVQELWDVARPAGFASLEIALHPDRPLLLGIEESMRIRDPRASKDELAELGRRVVDHRSGNQVFSLKKEAGGGLATDDDSRSAAGLAGTVSWLASELAIDLGEMRVSVEVTNTGKNWWRPSGPDVGCVNIGVNLLKPGSQAVELSRSFFSETPVRPGETRRVELELPHLDPECQISLGLVSEGVVWFVDIGSRALTLPSRE